VRRAALVAAGAAVGVTVGVAPTGGQ